MINDFIVFQIVNFHVKSCVIKLPSILWSALAWSQVIVMIKVMRMIKDAFIFVEPKNDR